jgi:hypothetical protein
MDSLLSIGSLLPARQTELAPARDAGSAPYIPELPLMQPNATAAVDSTHRSDPATDQQRMLHFISHVDAECFISLLQILDPRPDDYRARAEYKRFYHQLRETLEVPLPSPTA